MELHKWPFILLMFFAVPLVISPETSDAAMMDWQTCSVGSIEKHLGATEGAEFAVEAREG